MTPEQLRIAHTLLVARKDIDEALRELDDNPQPIEVSIRVKPKELPPMTWTFQLPQSFSAQHLLDMSTAICQTLDGMGITDLFAEKKI